MIKIKLLMALNYRWEFFFNLASQIAVLFITAFFWKAAYSTVSVAAGVDERQMLVYSVMAIVLACVNNITIENMLRDKVRRGNVAVDYIKPVNVFLMYYSEDGGGVITSILQNVLPIIICASLFIVAPIPASFARLLLFIAAAIVSFVMQWLLSAIFGLLYFKVIDMGPMGNIKEYLIKILSGTFVPIWFFPQFLQNFMNYLPFVYLYQFPLSIYIGKATYSEIATGFAVQFVWLIVFFVLFVIYRKRVEGNMMVQGG